MTASRFLLRQFVHGLGAIAILCVVLEGAADEIQPRGRLAELTTRLDHADYSRSVLWQLSSLALHEEVSAAVLDRLNKEFQDHPKSVPIGEAYYRGLMEAAEYTKAIDLARQLHTKWCPEAMPPACTADLDLYLGSLSLRLEVDAEAQLLTGKLSVEDALATVEGRIQEAIALADKIGPVFSYPDEDLFEGQHPALDTRAYYAEKLGIAGREADKKRVLEEWFAACDQLLQPTVCDEAKRWLDAGHPN